MGRVVEKKSGNPLSDVFISINGKEAKPLDLDSGYFEIIMPAGTHKIEFIKEDNDTSNVGKDDYEPLIFNNIELAENEVKYIKEITMVNAEPQSYFNFEVRDATNNRTISGATIKYRKNWGETKSNYIVDADGIEISDITNTRGVLNTARGLPSGYYTAEISKDGFITGYENFAVSSINSAIPDKISTVLCPELSANESRLVLTWGSTPSDLDSHLRGPGGMHVYYSFPSHQNIANLDVDDTNSYGPETITLYTERDGKYTYSVHDYSNITRTNSTAMSSSGAKVTFYYMDNGKEIIKDYYIPIGKTGNVWNVFSFTVTNKKVNSTSVSVLNTFKNQSNPSSVS